MLSLNTIGKHRCLGEGVVAWVDISDGVSDEELKVAPNAIVMDTNNYPTLI